MKKYIAAVILVGMLGWTIYNYVQYSNGKDNAEATTSEAVGESVGIEKGDLAPDFELSLITGESVKLSDYRGEKVFLNFWATWCPPCRVEMPDLQKIHNDEDAVVLGINLTKEEVGVDFVDGFMEYYNLSFPVLLDKEAEVALRYKVKTIPATYMINSDGTIHGKVVGPMNYSTMLEKIEKMY